MPKKVRVRLVPKTRDGRSIARELEMTPATAKANRPDPERAAEASRLARTLGFTRPRVTYTGSVDATLPWDTVEEIFDVSLEETTEPLAGPEREPEAVPEEMMRGQVDINTASEEQLEALPGLGAALAARITQARDAAPFTRVEDLRRVLGVGRVLIDELRPLITTGLRGPETLVEPRRRIRVSKALQVPEPLRGTIAFAYVPTPVEFLAETYIPPDIEDYHVRLADVANALQVPASHRNGWTGRGTRMAMIDTGFAPHPFFERQGYEIERTSTPSTQDPASDPDGHGTGESANVLFMAPGIEFIGVKHNDYSAEALETALEQRPDIITNSWCWNVDDMTWDQWEDHDENLYNELRDLENIINDAVDDGILVVFAAGNGHRAFPASMPAVLAVGGVTVQRDGSLEASSYASSFRSVMYPGRSVPDICGVVGEYTSTSPMPGHIMLPVAEGSDLEGSNMPSAIDADGWGVFSGTSAACPQVAGVAALLRSASRHRLARSPDEIRAILQATATDVTTGTTALGDTAVVGDDDATGSGFVNAATACALVADGAIESGLVDNVTNQWRTVTMSEEHDTQVAYLAAMQTFDGPDPAGVRIHQPTPTGLRIKIEDEQSKDAETHHNPEQVGYLAISPGLLYDRDSNPIGEVGMIQLDQPEAELWHRINLQQRYHDPVVVAQIETWNAPQPAHTRLRQVKPSSFEIQIEEWDYLNGTHPWETIAYLVLERGVHDLPAGNGIEAGVVSVDHTWASVPFSNGFTSAPVVLSASQTYAGDHAIVTRHRNVVVGGFDVRLQEEEARDGWHRVEQVGWIAVEQ